MIIRIFRARVRPGQEADFRRRLADETARLRRTQPGLLALHAGRLVDSTENEIAIVSIWRDQETLRAFADQQRQDPVIVMDRDRFLEDIRVEQYEQWGERG